jgi:ribosomal protein S18 acetylase RimI-like enzyme
MSGETPAKRPRRLVKVRQMIPADFPAIIDLCERTYPGSPPWTVPLLTGHLEIFPEGQLVAVDQEGTLLGYAASLIIYWDDYEMDASWRDFTSRGTFRNHDPALGRTLYGAEIMVHPEIRGSGVGGKLYDARFDLARRFKLLRIRAGARLRGYAKHAARLTAEQYVERVVRGSLRDPTQSFQVHRGFHVLAAVSGYLRKDPESLGWAAVIEWLNPEVATPADLAAVPTWGTRD